MLRKILFVTLIFIFHHSFAFAESLEDNYDITKTKFTPKDPVVPINNNVKIKDNDLKIIKKYEKTFNPHYSKDWKNFSFEAYKNWKNIIVKDWVEIGNNYPNIVEVLYSPEWTGMAFKVEDNWKYFIVKDWIEWEKYDEIFENWFEREYMKYSPNWKKFAHIARNWNENFVVENWIKWKIYSYVWLIKYSPDSSSISYVAEKEAWKSFIVKDWIESKIYNNISDIIYSSDSKSFSIIVKDEIGNYEVENYIIKYTLKQKPQSPESTKSKIQKIVEKYKNNTSKRIFLVNNLPNEIAKYQIWSPKYVILKEILDELSYDLISSTKWIKLLQSPNKDISIIDVDLNNAWVSFGWVFENNSWTTNSWTKDDFYKYSRNFANKIIDKTIFWDKLFALVNWQFFNSDKEITAFSFPIKSEQKIITDHLDNDSPKRTLIIDNNFKAKIIEWYDKSYLEDEKNKDVLVAFNPIVALWKDSKLWRSYIWLKWDSNIIFFIASNKTTSQMEKIISDYWVNKESILMLDWWPSAQFSYKWQKEKTFYWTWGVPQFNMIYER